MNSWRVLFSLATCLGIAIGSAHARQDTSMGKPTLAVLPMRSHGTWYLSDYSSLITSMDSKLRQLLFDKKRFTLVDRVNIEKVLKEQDFQASGMVPESMRTAVGQFTNARYIVNPRVTFAGVASELKGRKGEFLGYTYKVNLHVQVVDVQSGEVVVDNLSAGTSSDFTKAYSTNYESVGRAGENACEEALKAIDSAEVFALTGKIFESDPGKDFFRVDIGSEHGVKEGQLFEVVELSSFRLPDGTVEFDRKVIVLAKAVEVSGKASKLRPGTYKSDVFGKKWVWDNAKLKDVKTSHMVRRKA